MDLAGGPSRVNGGGAGLDQSRRNELAGGKPSLGGNSFSKAGKVQDVDPSKFIKVLNKFASLAALNEDP